MSDLLRDLPVLVLDCQAGGATPAHGDLLELGWAVCDAQGIVERACGDQALAGVSSHWITQRTTRRVPRPIRELTGWSEACAVDAISEQQAWTALREDSLRMTSGVLPVPTVIHFARFELSFLRDLHERLEGGGPFPFDPVCLHTLAVRLFPELPRRNIRALAGYLGHSPELVRRSAGHVAATAFIWRALIPVLEDKGVRTWSELPVWLSQEKPSPRPTRRVYPLAPERRLGLPDRPGVYRFVRRHGDVIYVGKAASLKKRVASHFAGAARATERALEMLTQVHDIRYTETASVLEAALLETDEIKQLDPPYNVQLRAGERSAWFSARDFSGAVAVPDALHTVGPLPSERALSPLSALIALVQGVPVSPRLCAAALAVPTLALPDEALFREGFERFRADHLPDGDERAARRVDRAARALWLLRGRKEVEAPVEDEAAPALWDLARVRRRLERNLVQTGLTLRRARWLCLLADADVVFRERGMSGARALILSDCAIGERIDLPHVAALGELAVRRPRPLRARQAGFDAAAYDRLRVLATELQRVRDDGGEVAVRIGAHCFVGDRLLALMRTL